MPPEIKAFQDAIAAQAPSLVPDEQRANQAYRNLVADLQFQILAKQNTINTLKQSVARISHHVGQEVKAKAALGKALAEIEKLKIQLSDAENLGSGSRSTTPHPKPAAELEECNRAKAGLVDQVTKLTQMLSDAKAAATASSASSDPDQAAALKKCNEDYATLKGERDALTQEKADLERAVQDAGDKANNGGSDGAVLNILGRALREMRDDLTMDYTEGLDLTHNVLQRAQAVVDRIKEKLGAGLISQADCNSRVQSATDKLQNELDIARGALNKARADLQDCEDSKPVQQPADSIPGLDLDASTQDIIVWSGQLYASLSNQVDSQSGALKKLGITSDKKIEDCEEKRKTLNDTIKDLGQQIEDLKKENASIRAVDLSGGSGTSPTDATKSIGGKAARAVFQRAIDKLNQQVKDLKEENANLKNGVVSGAATTTDDCEKEKEVLQGRINDLEARIDKLTLPPSEGM